jgi:hypothetical protein
MSSPALPDAKFFNGFWEKDCNSGMDTCGSALSGALVEKVSLGRFSRD